MNPTTALLARARERAALAIRESLAAEEEPDLEPLVKRLELISKAEGFLGERHRRDTSIATLLALMVVCLIALSLSVRENSGSMSLSARTTAMTLKDADVEGIGALTLRNASIAVSGGASRAGSRRIDLRDQDLVKISQFEASSAQGQGNSSDGSYIEMVRGPKCLHITTHSSDVSGSLITKSTADATPELIALRYSAEERSPLVLIACGSLEEPWRLRTRQRSLTLGETIRFGVAESSVVTSLSELAVAVDGVKIDASQNEVVNVVYDKPASATEFSSAKFDAAGQIAFNSSSEIISLTTGTSAKQRNRMPSAFQLLVENKTIVAIVTFAVTAIGLLWKLGKFFVG